MSDTRTTVIEPDQPDAAEAPPPHGRRGWLVVAAVAVVVVAVAIVVAVWSTSTGPTASDAAQVRASWVTFFDGSTPVATRVALLQDGAALRAVIVGQSHAGFARGLSATVSAVSVTSPTTATVTYAILDGGTPLLSGQHGQAVKVAGTWQVSTTSFCGLLQLEHETPPVCVKG